MARLGRTAAIILCAPLACAAWANEAGVIPLSTLNSGPSTESPPNLPGSRVAFFRWPSEVANPSVDASNPASPLAVATQVQMGTTGGIRWRERSMIPARSDVRPGTTIRVAAANTGFAAGASAQRSYIAFLTLAQFNNVGHLPGITGVIDTYLEMETFVTANPTNRVFLNNAAFHGGVGFADADLTSANLANGIEFRVTEIGAAVATYQFNQLALVVFKDAAANALPLVTEFAEIVGNARQFPTDAWFSPNNQTIRVVTNRPVVDAEADNPVDGLITPAAADFLIVPGGGGAPTPLSNFLTSSVPGSGGVASVTIEGTRSDVIRIDLVNPVTAPSEIATVLASRIFFATNDISSVVGDNTANNSAQAQTMDRPFCMGDANGDHVINFLDLNIVLSAFGTMVPPFSGPDLTGNGVVDMQDLNLLLSRYGFAC